MTSGTEQQKQIEAAMEHFRLGTRDEEAKVFIIAEVERLTIKTQFVRPIDPRLGTVSPHPREFFREQVDTQYFDDDRALIAIPKAYVKHYYLQNYVLETPAVEGYREKVAAHYKTL